MKYVFSTDLLIKKFKDSEMSYRQLAKIAGVSHMTIHRLFTSGEPPCINHLILLCDALGISPRSLFAISK